LIRSVFLGNGVIGCIGREIFKESRTQLSGLLLPLGINNLNKNKAQMTKIPPSSRLLDNTAAANGPRGEELRAKRINRIECWEKVLFVSARN
jgi:hypothetical protein